MEVTAEERVLAGSVEMKIQLSALIGSAKREEKDNFSTGNCAFDNGSRHGVGSGLSTMEFEAWSGQQEALTRISLENLWAIIARRVYTVRNYRKP